MQDEFMESGIQPPFPSLSVPGNNLKAFGLSLEHSEDGNSPVVVNGFGSSFANSVNGGLCLRRTIWPSFQCMQILSWVIEEACKVARRKKRKLAPNVVKCRDPTIISRKRTQSAFERKEDL
jgi:hypothetical protein